MADRPKTMAKQVTEVVERATMLESDVLKLIPRQYLKHTAEAILEDDCEDCKNYCPEPLEEAWLYALNTTLEAWVALGNLEGILLAKAAGMSVSNWRLGDYPDTPAPADPEPGNPETIETPDDTPDSADNPSAGTQGGAQAETG